MTEPACPSGTSRGRRREAAEGSDAAPSGRELRAPFVRGRRWLFFGLAIGTTLLGTLMMIDIVRAAGITALEVGIVTVFIPTFGWISVAFFNAVVGFVLQLLGRDPISLRPLAPPGGERERAAGNSRLGPRRGGASIAPRTAVVMPVLNEDPAQVMRGLAALVGSLEETGEAEHFDIHLLSDTTDADIARSEEAAWLELRKRVSLPYRLRYRRRATNEGWKAGNLADFCASSGGDYRYMIVLDADSVMRGTTLVELVRTMEANPGVGLIQTVPIPARQETLFGRFVQFAASLYSPMLAAGQSFWQVDTANYWGHNAIVRMRPFIEHCHLPVLAGSPPLGGKILSHDFVEAALLRRAGWSVYLLPHLGGSYEGLPANILDFVKRDRRWAQGSLQHLRLLGLPGLHPLSRLHFVWGAMGYVSSVLWLLLLLASTAYVVMPSLSATALVDDAWSVPGMGPMRSLVPLLGLTAVVLFLPKALGVALGALRRRASFGGGASLVGSGLLEALFSVLIAPLMMMYHTRSVIGILTGRVAAWATQPRGGREVAWSEAVRSTWVIMAVGVTWTAVTLSVSPIFLLWLTPIVVGIVLAAPLSKWTSSLAGGRWLLARGLLLTPAEIERPPELRQQPAGMFPVRRETASRVGIRSVSRSAEDEPASHGRAAETMKDGMHLAARGLFDLQRGRVVCVKPDGSSASEKAVLLAAVERLDAGALDRLRRLGLGPLRLVLTPYRAQSVGVSHGVTDAGPQGVSLRLNGESADRVLQLSSAPGPFDPDGLEVRQATAIEAAGLALARFGRLLPAVVAVIADRTRVPALDEALTSGLILEVDDGQIGALVAAHEPAVEVTYVSGAPVPLEEAEHARFMLFREANGVTEHVAILIGQREAWPEPVPVRVHSACLTGDLFGSLRCDCGEQLRRSLSRFAECGGGVLLYLEQEGRGIGLGNKLRAYALQQQGLDTIDADCVLGFGADERRYHAAVGILRQLGIEAVRIFTNNPDKVRALEAGGIRVVGREPLHGKLNRYNLPYVRAKVQRAGHWLGDMLEGASPGS